MQSENVVNSIKINRPAVWWRTDDWMAITLGMSILLILLALVWVSAKFASSPEQAIANPLSPYLAKPNEWINQPWKTFDARALLATTGLCWATFAIGIRTGSTSLRDFSNGFLCLMILAATAMTLSAQVSLKFWGLEYALWAILIGLLISNTIGTPKWIHPALHTELYIKTGLVLLGAKVLLGVLLKLGLPGLAVAWIVTPVVLVTTYWFGQRILKIPSRSLNMVISADMSVCGVSAAIATSAACRAKKEELSLAIGISMAFTVVMMIAMPQVAKSIGLPERVAGAWIGGTIDSTAAVGAAGKMVGPKAEEAAVTIKMIQNLLIGVVAFGVALYWVRFVETSETPDRKTRPDPWEIWYRFPKFVLGFLFASILFSLISGYSSEGSRIVDSVVKQGSEILRDWFFTLAFVSIGLESNFRELRKFFRGGKPVVLYVCGQTLNVLLTLAMACLVFSE